MEDDLKILKVEYITNRWTDFLKTLNLSLGNQTKNKMLKTKTTTRGGRPKKIESWIYQQPLIGFSSNLKLERQPQNIKCWISQQPLVDILQLLNWRSEDQNIFHEDNLQ